MDKENEQEHREQIALEKKSQVQYDSLEDVMEVCGVPEEDISLCPKCNCMTKKVCGKCGVPENTLKPLSKQVIEEITQNNMEINYEEDNYDAGFNDGAYRVLEECGVKEVSMEEIQDIVFENSPNGSTNCIKIAQAIHNLYKGSKKIKGGIGR